MKLHLWDKSSKSSLCSLSLLLLILSTFILICFFCHYFFSSFYYHSFLFLFSSSFSCPLFKKSKPPVRAFQRFWTLICAAEHLLPLFISSNQIFATLAQEVCQATVAFQLDHIGAGCAGGRVAGQWAGVRAGRASLHLTLQLAFPAIAPGHNGVRGVSYFVTIS